MLAKVIGGMFGLILVFLILSRAAEFNAIIRSVSSFVTQQTAQLQGYNTTLSSGISPGTPATQKIGGGSTLPCIPGINC